MPWLYFFAATTTAATVAATAAAAAATIETAIPPVQVADTESSGSVAMQAEIADGITIAPKEEPEAPVVEGKR